MKKYLEILKKCVLFDGIADDNLSGLLDCLGSAVKIYEKKETIFSEGEPAKLVGIVLSGKIQIERCDIDGNRSIVGMAEESDMFGESFACAGVKSLPVSVVTVEKSEILLIDYDRIISPCCNACGFHGKLIFNLLKVAAQKNLRLNKKLEILSGRTTNDKLMVYLRITAKEKNSRIFDIPFDRQELADFLEVDRSGLSVEISKMIRAGVIRNKKNHFELISDNAEDKN